VINATYYDIQFDGRIASPAASAPAMLAAPDIYGAFINSDPGAAFVGALLDRIPRVINLAGPFQPGDVDAIVDFRVTNIASTRTRGVDVNIAVSRETGIGLFAGRLNLNHVFEFDNRALPGGPASDDLDTLFRPLDFRLRGELSWAMRGAQVGIAVNYSDSYENRTAVPTERVDAYATVDARFSYTFPSDGAFALRNLSLFANFRNIFDEDPPFVSTGIEGLAYDGANADPFGRLISFGIRKRW
jgi:outer membrane receptor protein involved in Fe transport